MYTQPMIFPLDPEGEIYILQDESGRTIGTGPREVCEILRKMIVDRLAAPIPEPEFIPCRSNIRAAIAI
jgi:hypothetical protein